MSTEVLRQSKLFSLPESIPYPVHKTLWAWALLLPTLITLAIVAGWPLFRTLSLSFTESSLLSLDETNHYVGFQNYIRLFQDPDWWRSVKTTLLFSSVSVTLETVCGLIVALVLHQNFRGRSLVRAAVLVPWAIPTVVSAKMWAWMFHDICGVINAVLLKLGVISSPVAWLATPETSFWALVLVDVWKTTPFMALLLLAGLQLIPKEVEEAAKLDSNSFWRVLFSIILPMISPALVVAVIFRSLDALRIFDLIYVLTGTQKATASMSVFARQHMMEFQDFGYGSAAACCIFLIVSVLTFAYLSLVKPKKGRA